MFTVDRVDLQLKQFTSWEYNEHAASIVCTEPRCQGWMGRKYSGREACWSGGLEQSIALYFSAIRRHSGLEKVALIGSIAEQQWAGAQGLEQGVRKGLVRTFDINMSASRTIASRRDVSDAMERLVKICCWSGLVFSPTVPK